jgi:hypothetical protein
MPAGGNQTLQLSEGGLKLYVGKLALLKQRGERDPTYASWLLATGWAELKSLHAGIRILRTSLERIAGAKKSAV